VPATLFLVAVIAAALGVPLSSVAYWLGIGGSSVWTGQVLAAGTSTVLLALTAAVIITVLAFPAAFLAVRHRRGATVLAERTSYVAAAVPSLVVALALVTLTVHFARPIYQTYVTLLLGYLLLFLPRAMVPLRAGLTQSRVELEEASRALGQSRLATMRRVTLPLAAPGIASGAALVCLATATELTMTLMLGPTGLDTLATRFWSLTGSIDYVAAAPYAAMMIAVSAPVTYLLLQQSRRVAGR
jgi:iron(III) transport system permease protein